MYPPEVVTALREALRCVYWYKDDLRLFFQACELPPALIAKQGWHDSQEYKVRIAGRVLDELVSMGQDGIGPIRRVIQALLNIRSFDHLRRLEDGAEKVNAARRSIEALREIVYRHDEAFRKEQEEQATRKDALAEALRRKNDERERLQGQFYKLVGIANHQQRGLLFEKFLRDLFDAYDLNPRRSFKIIGEQIDGAFEFEMTQFLLEARWEKDPVGAAPLDSFSKKVERKLENTLGLFISLNGFTEEGLLAFRGTRPAIVLMDGEDLAVVLQGLLDFRDLLKRKIRHASQAGDPFLRAREM
ncbi:MAG: hypothetical protein ACREKR_01445 [Candidatus Methylomirabilales bacterium]